MNMTDSELLRHYVRDQSESAFTELVARHINLVHTAALRQVNGNAHLAEDVTQSVFTDLARKADRLLSHSSLTGWLYTSTRFVAANARRTESRRSHREQKAHAMNTILDIPESRPDWSHLSPLLDEAMHTLDEVEREAVLLRHFENCSYADVGAKTGLTENAARKRVDHALEKLHTLLTKQGVTLTAMALAGLLGANAVASAPAHLAAKVAKGALAGATIVGVASLFTQIVAVLKTKVIWITTAAVILGGLALIYATRNAALSEKSLLLPIAAAADLTNTSPLATAPVSQTLPVAVTSANKTDAQMLHLKIVAADSGKPIPAVPIEYRSWVGGKFNGKSFTSDRFGECDVDYPANITELQLTTCKDGIADTRLLWRPPNGEVIPTNYLLRVDWPVAIGGTVVDADGKPVVGAKVGWNHNDDPALVKLPQSHEFFWIETVTDENGKWRINRIAEEMIPLIYGSARHPDHAESGYVWGDRNKQALQQLRDGTHVFKMGHALSVSGVVEDAAGNPISDAKVFACTVSDSGKRETKSAADGTFSVKSSRSGEQLVTADANGFAPTTIKVNITANTEPVRLVLKPGKTLRILVTDVYGTPIPGATLWYDCINYQRGKKDDIAVQLDFSKSTDKQGRIVHPNAPDDEMRFTARAAGFQEVQDIIIRPDDQDHRITLENALIVHGEVRDADTHQLIPKFRIAQGWPNWNPADNTTNAQWSTIGRFWLDFSGGTYSKTFEESVMGGSVNRGYFLKFMAEGYQPFVSRLIAASEGEVELNVTLHPAQATSIAITAPNGRVAAFADVGMVAPGAHLELVPGGFSRENVQTGGALLQADKNGTFTLPSDPAVTRVIAASTDGYAEATPAELTANPILRLQPWGRLDAMIFSGGKPASGREYTLKLMGGSRETIDFQFLHLPTDAQGKLVIEKLPPGKLGLTPVISIQSSEESGASHASWSHGEPKTFFEIHPGETTRLDLGVSNCTVTAHLQWPAGMSPLPKQNIFAALHTPMPQIPLETMTNQAAMMALMQTEEFHAAQKTMRSFQGIIGDDGTIKVEDVEPGDYQFLVMVVSADFTSQALKPGESPNIQPVAKASQNVTIFGGEAVDIGTIQLKSGDGMP